MQITPKLTANPYVEIGTPKEKEMATAFINLQDKDIQTLAIMKTKAEANPKGHNKAISKMISATPIVAGLATAILVNGNLASKVRKGVGTGARFGLTLALFSGVAMAAKAIAKKSEKIKEFTEKNPTLSTMGTLALGIAGVVVGHKGINKALSAIPSGVVKKGLTKYNNMFAKLGGTKLFKNWLPTLSTKAGEVAARLPQGIKNLATPLKTAGKAVLAYSPLIMLGSAYANDVAYGSKLRKNAKNNYQELKSAQLETAKELTRACSVENDIKNQEPVA